MKYSPHKVFGWVIHKCEAAAGDNFDFVARRKAAHHRLSAQTMHTKGRITGHRADDPAQLAAERMPGFGNDMLPNPLPAVTMKMTAVEASEWWCVSVPANKSMPAVEYIRLQPGHSLSVSAGDLIFVCAGRASCNSSIVAGPVAVRSSNAGLLTALESPVYAMKFDRVGEAG